MADSSLLIVKNLSQLAKRCRIAQPRRLCGDFNPVSHLQSLSDSYFLICYKDGAQAYVYTSYPKWSLIDVLDLNEESDELGVQPKVKCSLLMEEKGLAGDSGWLTVILGCQEKAVV